MAVHGRLCEVTSGRFVEAKQVERRLSDRLLWSNPAGRFGSTASPHEQRLAGSTAHEIGLPQSGRSPPAPYAAVPSWETES